ncbi:DNA translocase FtsK [Ligilactobacillus ceti]|nr:DNA translocase FtsK [Ligilactobacillus ceti]
MQHYDGPAFYRKKQHQEVVKPSFKEKKKRAPQKRARKLLSEEKRNENQEILKQQYTTRTFHPKYVPPSIIDFSKRETKRKYQALVKRILAAKDELLLFVKDEQATDLELIDLTQSNWQEQAADLEQGALTAEKEVSQQAETEILNEEVVETPGVAATEDIEAARLMDEPTEHEFESTLVIDDHEQLINKDSEFIDEITSHDEFEEQEQNNEELIISREQAVESVTDLETEDLWEKPAPVVSSEKTELPNTAVITNKTEMVANEEHENPQPQEQAADDNHEKVEATGLNRTLTDIIDLENNEQRKLALFADAEQAATPNKEDLMYKFPPLDLLPAPVIEADDSMDEWVLNQIDVLNETLAAFHVDAVVKDWTIGPAVTQFEITLGRGVKVNKITNLADDLKLALAAKDIRIEAPIPGKSSVGVEIPNYKSRPVMLSEVLESKAFKEAQSPLTVALGVDLFGRPQVTNLQKMPHGLIAGATGSGKSVFINSLLVSILYKAEPSDVKLLLIDPKAVEMAPYQKIAHLIAPVISEPKAAAAALRWVVEEMENRYQKLAAAGVRNIASYNEKALASGKYEYKLPYIVVVIDELADLMMVAASEVQDYIARITQKARAAGIHLIVATQRPSVDVITGTIKNNIPTRIAFMVSSQIDSRTILDVAGAERLLGRGDMLFMGNGSGQPVRLQGTYVEEEVDAITDFIRQQGKPQYAFDPESLRKKDQQNEAQDDLMPEVLEYIAQEDNISTSKLQRVFSIGYNRAANIVDDLEAQGLISPARGSKPRDVYLDPEMLNAMNETK